MTESRICSNLTHLLGHLATLSNPPATLVAVSKLKLVIDIMAAYKAGQRHFGENYVSELCEKAPQLPSDIRWHFIGHLQSNKVRKLLTECPDLYMVESVDSAKLASKLDQTLASLSRTGLKVLVEVRTSLEETKSGVSVSEVAKLVEHIKTSCPNLCFDGLMTIADPNDPETCFEQLRALGIGPTLSMGMSGDYPIAISHGSTQVRIGSTIFGSR